MATAQKRGKTAVGSAQWIVEERDAANQFVKEETEEFAFAVRNEMEWLNEHMAEVFNKSQFDVVEMFKTPGKLRGKTPRTARKHNGLEARAPLTDIFAPNIQAFISPQGLKSPKPIARFQVAEDENSEHEITTTKVRFDAGSGKENADSGYHEMTDESSQLESPEADQPSLHNESAAKTSPKSDPFSEVGRVQESHGEIVEKQAPVVDTVDMERDEPISNNEEEEDAVQRSNPTAPTDFNTSGQMSPQPTTGPELTATPIARQLTQPTVPIQKTEHLNEQDIEVSPVRGSTVQHSDTPRSESTSPARTLLRKKSSLTFASLPAREPLTSKKSVGPNIARSSHVQDMKRGTGDYFGVMDQFQHHDELENDEAEQNPPKDLNDTQESRFDLSKFVPAAAQEVTNRRTTEAELRAQSRASTMRLQERLAMLGKSNQPRLSRPVPSTVLVMQTTIQKSPSLQRKDAQQTMRIADEPDDWIGPITVQQSIASSSSTAPKSPGKGGAHAMDDVNHEDLKNPTTMHSSIRNPVDPPTNFARPDQAAPGSPARSALLTYPQLHFEKPASTTPMGSPAAPRYVDGPLSASKAKLQSVFKSARGMFTSTASFMAHSSKDVHSQPPSSPLKQVNLAATSAMSHEATAPTASQQLHRADKEEVPRRRSSQRIALKRVGPDEEPGRDGIAYQSVSSQLPLPSKSTQEPRLVESSTVANANIQANSATLKSDEPFAPSSPAKQQESTSRLQKPGELRRLLRPNKDALKARPAPVSIKLASQRIGQIASSNASLGMALHESLSQPAPTRPALTKKTSTSSFTTSTSSQSFKTASSGRPKALEAAARKREQDEREAQRKAEQKREMERRRLAKAEDERIAAEQLKRVAQQKAFEEKIASQKQAAEARKAEGIRRNEQVRKDAAESRARALEDTANSAQFEQHAQQPTLPRTETSTVKPGQRNEVPLEAGRAQLPHVNPAKPPKRHFDFEDDKPAVVPLNSAVPSRANTIESQAAPKRRRTDENEVEEVITRPTMGPPLRPSNMNKNKFTQGFLNTGTAAHNAPTMLKSAVTAAHNAHYPKTPHMNDLVKTSNAKITFAETQTTVGPSTIKRPQPGPSTKTPATTHKSSPQYPNTDSIELPDIASDSDDSDDEEAFQPPSWANSPALRELLQQQQLVDPLQVFGPVAPVSLEEVFKGNKERQAKFRARMSSSNWNGPDKLSEEERRRDHEARERLERNGGWVYGNFGS